VTTGQRVIEWLDAAGKTTPLLSDPATYQFPRISPDGSRLAYMVSEGSNSDIWVYDLRESRKTRITVGGVNSRPLWSPDSKLLVFRSPDGISWVRTDSAEKPQLLTVTKTAQSPTSFSPDGKLLAAWEVDSGGGALLRAFPLTYDSGQPKAGAPEVLLQTAAGTPMAAFSPDGRWLAYASADSGKYEIYVRAFPYRGGQRQVSNDGGLLPVWSRTSHELFYRTDDQQLMAVDYSIQGDSFTAGKPRLFTSRFLADTGNNQNFDLAPDGKRMVALMPAEGPEPMETRSHVTLVLNFVPVLRR